MIEEKPIRSAIRPKIIPDAMRIARMTKFSFLCLLTLKSTISPTPAAEKRPDIIAPTEIIPERPSFVSATDAAHPGIRPISDAVMWLTNGTALITLPSVSEPMKNTRVLIKSVTIKIKSEMVRVWWIAEWRIPRSQ